MKCSSCGGNLRGTEPHCRFCGSREEVDLKTVNRRDLGVAENMSCPRCEGALHIERLQAGADAEVRFDVEHCLACSGIFFNPGELETFLHNEVVSTIWLDHERMASMRQTESDPLGRLGVRPRHYLPCPVCLEIMNSQNFGRRSGVLIDLCRFHGVWLDGGELRKISEWWQSGGKHVHQANETAKAVALTKQSEIRREPMGLFTGSKDSPFGSHRTNRSPMIDLVSVLGLVIGYLLS